MHLKERCDCLSHDVVTLNVDRNVSNTYCWSSSGEDFKYTCVYYNPLSSEEDKQYVVETSRTTSKVTTSCGKRLYFSFESVIYHDDLPNRFTIYHPNGWQISPPPPPPAPLLPQPQSRRLSTLNRSLERKKVARYGGEV